MNRLLRSRKLRAVLYYAANGKCQICGKDLPDDWHADHIKPWSKTRRTNVHEMQALCPKCNVMKGDHFMPMRQHQGELNNISLDIAQGENTYVIIIDGTPGAGKSVLPIIIAERLIPHKIDKVLWVVPRDNLRAQGEHNCIEQKLKEIYPHSVTLRASGNEINPSRGTNGYITTYQAISENPELHLRELERYRYAVIWDEPHHLEEGGIWHQASQPLYEKAVLNVLMSGTFERGDKKKIAWVPYKPSGRGEVPDFSPREGYRFIHYTRRMALHDKAIMPVEFLASDASASWIDADNAKHIIDSIATEPDPGESRDGLFVALKTEAAIGLLLGGAEHWRNYKEYVYPASKLLVIAASIAAAYKYQKALSRLSIKAEIATYDKPAEAKEAIERFRSTGSNRADILITVQMAYEGLDVQEISHEICLTDIRSKPWLEQAYSRVNRTCEGKGEAFVFCPRDQRNMEVIKAIEEEQIAATKELRENGGSGGGGRLPWDDIIPVSSELGDLQAIGIDAGLVLTPQETGRIKALMDEHCVRGSIVSVYRLVEAVTSNQEPAPPPGGSPSEEKTISSKRLITEGRLTAG
jgi:superfamily II DNA or RNA helicase